MFSKYLKNSHVEVRLDLLCKVQKSKAMDTWKEMLFCNVNFQKAQRTPRPI